MPIRHTGSCHCGAVRFAFDGEVITKGLRCTCSICSRKGALMYPDFIPGEALEIDAAEGSLGLYQFGAKTAKHSSEALWDLHVPRNRASTRALSSKSRLCGRRGYLCLGRRSVRWQAPALTSSRRDAFQQLGCAAARPTKRAHPAKTGRWPLQLPRVHADCSHGRTGSRVCWA